MLIKEMDEPRLASRPLTAAVIGCGAIAHEHLRYIASTPRAALIGVADKSPATMEFARNRFGARQGFTDAEALIEMRPDVVHVLTPPDLHAKFVSLALASGSHVICEKPMTASANETRALLELAKEQGRLLVESRNALWVDSVLAAREHVRSGTLGTLREIDVALALDLANSVFGDPNLSGPGVRLPGGAAHDFLPHLAYLFLDFAGTRKVDSVTGYADNLTKNERVGLDSIDVLIRAGQVRGSIRISPDTRPDGLRLVLRGTLGSLETDLYNPYLRVTRALNSGLRAPLEQIRSGFSLMRSGLGNIRNKVRQHTPYHGMPRMLDAIYCSIQEGRPSPIDPDDILATAELIDQILSLRHRR